jgi:hypothetical protein
MKGIFRLHGQAYAGGLVNKTNESWIRIDSRTLAI